MIARRPVDPAPGPLETYCQQFDALLSKSNQCESLRRYLEGLLLPQERNKTLTALANTEPVVGAQQPPAQALQWFLSESLWDSEAITQRHVEVLCADPLTAPHGQGVLVIDEHGDLKWGTKTAHVGRQYLANLGKTDNGVASLWADEGVYYPLHVEPYTPAPPLRAGQGRPALPHQAADRRRVGASGPGRRHPLPGGRGRQLLRRGRGAAARAAGTGAGLECEHIAQPLLVASVAIRRHWALVCCAFAFCWYNLSQQNLALAPAPEEVASSPTPAAPSPLLAPASSFWSEAGRGKISGTLAPVRPLLCWPLALRAVALLARVVERAPTRAAVAVA